MNDYGLEGQATETAAMPVWMGLRCQLCWQPQLLRRGARQNASQIRQGMSFSSQLLTYFGAVKEVESLLR
jgi:hypothetical protein